MRIVVVSGSIGQGHDGVARELARRLGAAGISVQCHDFVSLWPGGRLLKASYARQLRIAPRSWGYLLTALARSRLAFNLVVAWVGIGSARGLRRALGVDPALVVSTFPLASQALGRLRRLGRLRVPVVTFLTDMSVHPLWVAAGVDVHLALHEVAARRAIALGGRDVRVTGPAVAPAFRAATGDADRRAARERFGLPAEMPLALVVAGSWGVGEISATATDLADTGLVAPVVACGRNENLRAGLAGATAARAVGWTDRMADLMRACDVVVQNAGGLSSLEAMATQVPVLSYRPLPGHGRTNAAALDEAGWAPWVQDPADLATAVKVALTERVELPAPGGDPAEVIAALAEGHR